MFHLKVLARESRRFFCMYTLEIRKRLCILALCDNKQQRW
jgi:hypothetical protein